MAQKLPKKDVVIIGLGWTGSILAHELTDEGLDVIAIERGPWRDAPTDFPTTYVQDELRYRKALAALDQYCKKEKGGAFVSLSDADKDAVIGGLESGAVKLDSVDGQAFFELLLGNTREGFFADPIYGGNRDMCSWRMIGYPGARYDYRDWVHRHNERYPRPPVSFMGRADWNAHKT